MYKHLAEVVSTKERVENSALLADVHTPRTTKSSKEYTKLRRDVIDPRPQKYRRQKSLKDFNLTALAATSNGNAAAL